MSKVAVVYFSSTGNTQTMAEQVKEGAQQAGAEVTMIEAGEFSQGDVANYDAIAFGCPAYGVEVLEESTFEPMFTEVESLLAGKKVGLFGSYGWGDGTWMTDWYARTEADGADLVAEGVIANYEPDEESLEKCRQLGAKLA